MKSVSEVCSKLYQNKIVRLVLLCLLLLAYTFLGGVAFWRIEERNQAKTEANQVQQLEASTKNFSDQLWTLVHSNRTFNESKLNSSIENLLTAYAKSVMPDTTDPYRWSLVTGLYYSMTIYTTVGYGNVACSTTLGRVISIVYALFGIPLTLVVLGELGSGIEALLNRIGVCCFRKCRKESAENSNTIWCVSAVAFLYLFLCSVICMLATDWSFFTSFYFFFVTFSTIGFGDVVPRSPGVALLGSVLLLIGMAQIATIISILQTRVQSRYAKSTSKTPSPEIEEDHMIDIKF